MVRCLFALAGLSVSSSASRHFFDLTIGDRIGAPAAEAFQQPAPGHLATVNDLTLAGLRGAVIIEQFRRTALGRRFRLGRTSCLDDRRLDRVDQVRAWVSDAARRLYTTPA